MSYPGLLTLLAAALFLLGVVEQGWAFLTFWPGTNCLALAIAYRRRCHRFFGKRPDGTLPLWSWCVFFPVLAYAWIVWRLLRRLTREPPFNAVTEDMVVGRRLLPSELAGQFDNFVDLTAEFPEPAVFRRSPGYFSFPLLDGSAPSPEALSEAVRRLRPGRTYIHCAQGHGRTCLFALAVLLHSGKARGVEEGLRLLCAARPGVRLSRTQRTCIQQYAATISGSANTDGVL